MKSRKSLLLQMFIIVVSIALFIFGVAVVMIVVSMFNIKVNVQLIDTMMYFGFTTIGLTIVYYIIKILRFKK